MKPTKRKKIKKQIPSTGMETKQPLENLPPKGSRDFLDPRCRKIVWGMPQHEKNEILEKWIWRSLCNRYWIARVSPSYGFKPYYTWGRMELLKLHGGGSRYADYFGDVRTQDYRHTEYRELYRCLEKIKEDFENRNQMTALLDESTFMEVAQVKKLDSLPSIVETKMEVEERRVVLDRFGSVEGSDKSKFNAVITRKWMTFVRLKGRSRVKTRVYRHLLKLVRRGFVVRSNGKYRLHKKYG